MATAISTVEFILEFVNHPSKDFEDRNLAENEEAIESTQLSEAPRSCER